MARLTPEQDFHGWLPIRIWQVDGHWQVDWCWFGEQRLTRPFFRDDVEQALRLPFNQAFRRQTGLDALLTWQTASPGLTPSAFIFHASRCGSTLMAQMLAALEGNIVLSEPPPLDSLLRAHRLDSRVAPRQSAWLAALLSAYGQRRSGNEQRLFIKLDAWNVFEAPMLLVLYPDVPRLFLYRDPLETAVSQLRQPGMHCTPGLLGATGLDAAGDIPQQMSRSTYISRAIGRTLEAGLELCRRHGGIPVNYCELPNVAWGRLAAHLAIKEADIARLQDTAQIDAKNAGMTFIADGEQKRRTASAELLEDISYWASAPYRELEERRLEHVETQ